MMIQAQMRETSLHLHHVVYNVTITSRLISLVRSKFLQNVIMIKTNPSIENKFSLKKKKKKKKKKTVRRVHSA